MLSLVALSSGFSQPPKSFDLDEVSCLLTVEKMFLGLPELNCSVDKFCDKLVDRLVFRLLDKLVFKLVDKWGK